MKNEFVSKKEDKCEKITCAMILEAMQVSEIGL